MSEPSKESSGKVKWAVSAAVVAGLFASWFFLPVQEWMESFSGWVEELGVLGGVVFAALYAVATVLLVPGAVLTVAAGLTFGLWGFPVVVAGATAGATGALLAGRYLARDTVEERIAGSDRFRAIDQAVEEEGWKIVALMRLSPLVPFNLQNYLYGLTKIGVLPYVLATFFGIMPGTLLYVYLGAAGKAALSGGGDPGGSTLKWVFFGIGLAATAVVTVVVTRAAKRKLDAIGVEGEGEGRGDASGGS